MQEPSRLDPQDDFEFNDGDGEKKPKKSTYIDEDLRAKFFAKEESKSEDDNNDDWQLEDDEFQFLWNTYSDFII